MDLDTVSYMVLRWEATVTPEFLPPALLRRDIGAWLGLVSTRLQELQLKDEGMVTGKIEWEQATLLTVGGHPFPGPAVDTWLDYVIFTESWGRAAETVFAETNYSNSRVQTHALVLAYVAFCATYLVYQDKMPLRRKLIDQEAPLTLDTFQSQLSTVKLAISRAQAGSGRDADFFEKLRTGPVASLLQSERAYLPLWELIKQPMPPAGGQTS